MQTSSCGIYISLNKWIAASQPSQSYLVRLIGAMTDGNDAVIMFCRYGLNATQWLQTVHNISDYASGNKLIHSDSYALLHPNRMMHIATVRWIRSRLEYGLHIPAWTHSLLHLHQPLGAYLTRVNR